MMKKYSIILLFGILSACGPYTIVQPDGTVERYYLGYVKVVVPTSYSNPSSVSALEVTAAGIRIQDGFGFGYFHDKEVTTPRDCRVVFLVRDKQQLDYIKQFMETKLGGQDICAGVY